MAERDEKWPENVKGKFYVDEQCIDCDLCRETAPENFTRNEDGGYSLVYKQPTSQEERICAWRLLRAAQSKRLVKTANNRYKLGPF